MKFIPIQNTDFCYDPEIIFKIPFDVVYTEQNSWENHLCPHAM